jgi:hypothetical protein
MFKLKIDLNKKFSLRKKEKQIKSQMKNMNVQEVNEILRKKFTHYSERCKYLANRYNETLEGKYCMEYNILYPLLYLPLSDEKKVDLYNTYTTRF